MFYELSESILLFGLRYNFAVKIQILVAEKNQLGDMPKMDFFNFLIKKSNVLVCLATLASLCIWSKIELF